MAMVSFSCQRGWEGMGWGREAGREGASQTTNYNKLHMFRERSKRDLTVDFISGPQNTTANLLPRTYA
jgi:hypothetical protein